MWRQKAVVGSNIAGRYMYRSSSSFQTARRHVISSMTATSYGIEAGMKYHLYKRSDKTIGDIQQNTRRMLTTSASLNQKTANRSKWLSSPTSSSDQQANAPFYSYFDNGKFMVSSSHQLEHSDSHEHGYPVLNPATQELLGYVPELTKSEVDTCIQHAKEAFTDWKFVPVLQRQRIMLELQYLIRKNMDDLAYLISLENGKTVADSKGDITRGLECVEASCGIATHLMGESMQHLSAPSSRHNLECVSYREPLGVVAGICPFNFPVMIPLWMFPLAIAAGNTMILKPSEKTPSASLLLADLCQLAGLPPGVLQIVHGGKGVVDTLIEHPDVQALSFVGSDAVGKYIYKQGTALGKRVQANLGAKNHAVVLPDSLHRSTSRNSSDHQSKTSSSTVTALVGAAFGAAGQRCMALSKVIFVSEDSNDGETEFQAFLEELVHRASQYQIGPGLDPSTDIGPLISIESKDRICKKLDQAVDGGANLILDGRVGYENASDDKSNKSAFMGPTILSVSSTENIAYQEELFGPILTCLRVNTLEGAIQIINQNKYGNGCAVFTNSGSAARTFTHNVEAGQVGINVPIPVPLPMFSFTGNKASMWGDLNFYGKSGVQFYTQLKTVTSHWPDIGPSDHGLESDGGEGSRGGVTMPIYTK